MTWRMPRSEGMDPCGYFVEDASAAAENKWEVATERRRRTVGSGAGGFRLLRLILLELLLARWHMLRRAAGRSAWHELSCLGTFLVKKLAPLCCKGTDNVLIGKPSSVCLCSSSRLWADHALREAARIGIGCCHFFAVGGRFGGQVEGPHE
jgi:hypothetical protein